jgi:tetrahydromethanopterin S-methyltransferase subunit C
MDDVTLAAVPVPAFPVGSIVVIVVAVIIAVVVIVLARTIFRTDRPTGERSKAEDLLQRVMDDPDFLDKK